MKFDNLLKKIVGQTVESSSKDVRSIERIVEQGYIKYRVIYTTITHYIVKNKKGDIIKEYDVKTDKTGIILFADEKLAEAYAKSVYKAEKWICEDEYSPVCIAIYPNGYQSIKKYGYFKLKNKYVYSFSIEDFGDFSFKFYDRYEDTYGGHVPLPISCLLNGTSINQVIKNAYIDVEPGIIKSFDVITLESVPYDKIKASSKELEEMNRILKEFKEAQEKYTNLLEKITNAK